MAKSLVGLAVAMALAAAVPAPVAAQQAGLPPPGPEEAMADFLTAELAAQRGETGPAIATLSQLARELRDPGIARRAVEIAIRARAMEPALEMAMLLVELEPESTLGRDLVASLLAGRGDVEKARETARGLRGQERSQAAAPFAARLLLRPVSRQGRRAGSHAVHRVALPETAGVALRDRRGGAHRRAHRRREGRVERGARPEARLVAGAPSFARRC